MLSDIPDSAAIPTKAPAEDRRQYPASRDETKLENADDCTEARRIVGLQPPKGTDATQITPPNILLGISPGIPSIHHRQFRHVQLGAPIWDEVNFERLALACAVTFEGWIGCISICQLPLDLADSGRD
jgi:hypothetical protein